jgi:glutamate-1-semialdehyde 2,1-aminomutase
LKNRTADAISEYVSKTPKSNALFERSRRSIPGGVNYGLRYFEPYPPFMTRGRGCFIEDVDGNSYLDFWIGHLALIMGHAYPKVVSAASAQLREGAHLGFEQEWEVKLAEQVKKMIPSIELIRFANSGTEANMYATRVARTYTGRQVIAKFEGGWHGGFDGLHKAVSYPFSQASSAGLPKKIQDLTLVLPFNDLEGAARAIKAERPAAVVLDTIPGYGGFIPATKEFVKGIREACDSADSLLVLDEVISGFRLSPGGAQAVYGLKPDLTILGKIVGGSMFPAGAFGGRRDIMELIDQTKYKEAHKRSFHGGTYSGNPMIARAGYTLLRELEDGSVQRKLDSLGDLMRRMLEEVFESNGIDAHVTGRSSLLGIQFMSRVPTSARESFEQGDAKMTEALFYHMLANGIIYMSPGKPNMGLCASHNRTHVERFVNLTEKFVRTTKKQS